MFIFNFLIFTLIVPYLLFVINYLLLNIYDLLSTLY